MLILPISEYLNKLLEDGCLTSIAALCELRRIVVVAIDFAVVLVVTVLRTKNGRTDRTGEVFDVIFALKGCNVRASQRATAFEAQEIEATKVVGLT